MKDISAYFNGMFQGIEADRLNNGCKLLPTKKRNTPSTFIHIVHHLTVTKNPPVLGKTNTFFEINDGSHITTLTISYWKTVEHLHAFAHSPAHREGWDWWLKGRKEYPHLGIYHETFAAPAGHWENIYENMVPIGMGMFFFLICLIFGLYVSIVGVDG